MLNMLNHDKLIADTVVTSFCDKQGIDNVIGAVDHSQIRVS